jgi:DNA-binding GntR family transcriptional regulator
MTDETMLELRPAARQTLGENIADSLREAIFGGVFRPGQRLAEAQIAGRLKVSRAPVREALAVLDQEGLVRRSVNRGTTVVRFSRRDVDEICSLRLPLEVLAARRAVAHATEASLEALAANIRETEAAGTPERLTALDLEFHETLLRAADHGRLLSAWQGLRSQIRLLMLRRNVTDARSRRGTVLGHRELLEAIRARDEARAVALVERDHQRQFEWLIQGFDEAEATGSPS